MVEIVQIARKTFGLQPADEEQHVPPGLIDRVLRSSVRGELNEVAIQGVLDEHRASLELKLGLGEATPLEARNPMTARAAGSIKAVVRNLAQCPAGRRPWRLWGQG
ncbi:MAG TPA: hypothetical protein PKA88_36750 [Polyangiaceae bacterium]|nr:hypothetical protein [Polyangiaceae bacterium]